LAVPGRALAEASRSCRQVLVFELNAGRMLDDVSQYAHDRDAIRPSAAWAGH
jgi:2-oxoglutarate ferredoxin oxidoreductase subunit alpha